MYVQCTHIVQVDEFEGFVSDMSRVSWQCFECRDLAQSLDSANEHPHKNNKIFATSS